MKKTTIITTLFAIVVIASAFSFKVLNAPDKGKPSVQEPAMVGTIISSALDYDNLIKITNDPKVINPAKSKWIPADGRSIQGSLLNKLTNMPNSPDLRGRFTRGLNTIYSVGQPVLDIGTADQDGANRVVGDFQNDELESHSHNMKGSTLNCGAPPGYRVINGTDAPTYDQRTKETGGSETRPKNIAVYYYIRIN